jgi:hypothetical protein
MGEQPETNGRPRWPDLIHEVRASETRVRADIAAVKDDVECLSDRVTDVETQRKLDEQRTRDWFRVGSMARSGVLLAIAASGAILGIINFMP